MGKMTFMMVLLSIGHERLLVASHKLQPFTIIQLLFAVYAILVSINKDWFWLFLDFPILTAWLIAITDLD